MQKNERKFIKIWLTVMFGWAIFVGLIRLGVYISMGI